MPSAQLADEDQNTSFVSYLEPNMAISAGVVATAASVVGTTLLLNIVGAALALYPRRGPGRERGLLTQDSIKVRITS